MALFLLPARCPPSRKARAIFVGCRRIMRTDDTLYMPAWSSSTLIERAPEPEVEEIIEEHPAMALLRELKRDAFLEFQATSAVLSVCRGQSIDSTLLKGLYANA